MEKILPEFKNSDISFYYFERRKAGLNQKSIHDLMNVTLGDNNTSPEKIFNAMCIAIQKIDNEFKGKRAIVQLELILRGIGEGVPFEEMIEIISDNLRIDIESD